MWCELYWKQMLPVALVQLWNMHNSGVENGAKSIEQVYGVYGGH
jgi:hypothetical protein